MKTVTLGTLVTIPFAIVILLGILGEELLCYKNIFNSDLRMCADERAMQLRKLQTAQLQLQP